MRHSLLLLVALLLPTPSVAQVLDPDWNWSGRDTYYHAAAGAAIDVAVRSGVIAKSWRTSAVRRVALVALVGAAYEGVETFAAWENDQLGEPGHGFGFKDLVADVTGAVLVEVVAAVAKRLK